MANWKKSEGTWSLQRFLITTQKVARFVAFLIFFLNKDYFLLIYFDELLHEFCDMWLFWQGFFFYIKGFFFSIKKFWNVFRVKLKQGLLWQKFENHYIVLGSPPCTWLEWKRHLQNEQILRFLSSSSDVGEETRCCGCFGAWMVSVKEHSGESRPVLWRSLTRTVETLTGLMKRHRIILYNLL